jgi:hypothetical protein
MFARSRRTVVMTLALTLFAALALGGQRAQAKAPVPAAAMPKAAAPRADAKKIATRPRAADDSSLYTCHPGEDLSCTVIHETAKGVVVVTFRPSGAKETREWSVVNEPSTPGGASDGGTIYIVPSAGAQPISDVHRGAQSSSNNAPILD